MRSDTLGQKHVSGRHRSPWQRDQIILAVRMRYSNYALENTHERITILEFLYTIGGPSVRRPRRTPICSRLPAMLAACSSVERKLLKTM